LTEKQWREALAYCGRSRITLALGNAARNDMPQWVRERVDGNASQNALRLQAIEEVYHDLGSRLTDAGIGFVALKGVTHAALFGTRRESRVQYDIDLFCPPESVYAARDVLLATGYESLEGMDHFPTDHLPAMMRKTDWEWRGDFFDLAIPTSVELHFQFWNEGLERLPAPGTGGFWERRTTRMIGARELPVLCPADALAYASLHLLKHVLQGSATPAHVYEIACVLDSHADRDGFWSEWRALHSPELRRLQAVIFRLAQEWFGCRAGSIPLEEIVHLPEATRAWFAEFALSPATSVFHPNKDELWLHLSLLNSRRDKLHVAWRRMVPGNLPPLGAGSHVMESERTWKRLLREWARYGVYFASRLRHHALSLPRTGVSGARWWWKTNGLGSQFWMFLAVAVVFNLGVYIFVLLYNLFLMDLGFREDFLGLVNGASRVGGLAGTIPAAFLAQRYGLRNSLVGTIAGTAAIELARAVIGARLPLAGLAFASGFIFSLWAVIMAPIIAGTVDARRCPTAFSFFFACMYATGMVGGWVGGRLPVWMHGKRPVLLLAAAMAALAVLPALRLKPSAAIPGDARVYPRGRFLLRFLGPFAVWHLATGSFNPFNNVYFARLGFPVQQIGNIFSGAQLVQVGAVLMAPLVIRRAGLLTGIVLMMAATALAMGGLATQASGAAAILAYIAYMSFQWMSEPGLNSLLMNRIDESERSGASALTFLVAFGAQALAALGAGELLTRFGYGAVLAGAAALTGVAAAMFRWLVR
jgi:predicted MFS family arabinose efflux permease